MKKYEFSCYFQFLLCPIFLATGHNYPYVTCGSSLKLINDYHNIRLHSHDIRYGQGSGQQSVTGVSVPDDHNSYWQINSVYPASDTSIPLKHCTRGEPVKCGDIIKLTHLSTQKNLHSHHYASPLSNNYEVSAFGNDGVGDEGDEWKVICSSEHWHRDERVRFSHVQTNSYLHASGETYNRPIYGQMEICGVSFENDANLWSAAEGIYVKPDEQKRSYSISESDDDDSDSTTDNYIRDEL